MLRSAAICIASLTALAATSAMAQQTQGPEVQTIHVSGNIYMLMGAGGNVGVSAGEDGIIIIDDQFEYMAPKLKAAIRAIKAADIKFVLNTHWHGDHAGGNQIFGREAPIIAHTNARVRLSAGKDLSDAVVRAGLPTVTFDKSMSLHFNGEEIKIIHFPEGHTDTDCAIFFTESNVVHMGDHFFKDRFPFIDASSGGTVDGYIRNIKNILNDLPENAKIIPGHGELATVADFRAFVAGVEETAGIVKKKAADGKSLDEIVKEGLPAQYSSWGSGFISTERWIGIVHASLSN